VSSPALDPAPAFPLGARRIYVSTACLPTIEPLHTRLSRYASYGLYAVELGAGVHVDEGILTRISGEHNRWLIHNYFPPPDEPFILNLASGDDVIRGRSLTLVLKAVELSIALGAPFYSVHAGFVTDPVDDEGGFYFPDVTSSTAAAEAFERFVSSLEAILDYALPLGIQILVENNVCNQHLVGKLLLQTPGEFEALFKRVPSPGIGVLVDTGHLNVSANSLGFDPVRFFDVLAPRVRALHLHDNDGRVDLHAPVTRGSGIMGVLRRPAFQDVPIIIEAKFDEVSELREHYDWLRMELKDD
jgi:sugar phosphate isomerase/epimerase